MPLPELAPPLPNRRLTRKARELAGINGSKVFSLASDDKRKVVVTTGWSGKYLGRSTKVFVLEEAETIPGKRETVRPSHGVEIVSFPLARILRPKIIETIIPTSTDSWGNIVLWNNGIDNRDPEGEKGKLKIAYQPSIQEYFDILVREKLIEIPKRNSQVEEQKKGRESATKFREESERLVDIGWSNVPQDAIVNDSKITVNYISDDAAITIVSKSKKQFKVHYKAVNEDHRKKFLIKKNGRILVSRYITGKGYEKALPVTKFECDELIKNMQKLTEENYHSYSLP